MRAVAALLRAVCRAPRQGRRTNHAPVSLSCAGSRALAVLAHITAAYPLLLLGSLYGQWLLSWWVLGHQPRPSLDDPKYIAGASWMHGVTSVALLGYVPVLVAALALNTLHARRQGNPWAWLATRIPGIVLLWLSTLVLLRSDPGRVVCWWFD